MTIITIDMVRKAVKLVKPAIIEILLAEGTTWGPKWVMVHIKVPGFSDGGIFSESITANEEGGWKGEWGHPKEFSKIALAKLNVANREKTPTSVIVATKPWLLEEGEYLHPGGTERDGISVAVSGAKGRVDEAIAEIVLSAIRMLAFLETDKRILENKMQI